jgi:hypothetical protein
LKERGNEVKKLRSGGDAEKEAAPVFFVRVASKGVVDRLKTGLARGVESKWRESEALVATPQVYREQ